VQDSTRDGTKPGAISGARLVLAILGALAILVAVVLLAFAIFEPEAAPCATGELATNRLVDGRYEPRNEVFETLDEAEAFICHDVPELRAGGWTLTRIAAERTVPIEFLVEGEGVGAVTLSYEQAGSGRVLTLDAAPNFGRSYFESQVPPQRTEEPVEVSGIAGTAYRFGINPDFVTVIWLDGSLEHRAAAQLTADFTLTDLIEVLETIE
jgi:hypothetical protein